MSGDYESKQARDQRVGHGQPSAPDAVRTSTTRTRRQPEMTAKTTTESKPTSRPKAGSPKPATRPAAKATGRTTRSPKHDPVADKIAEISQTAATKRAERADRTRKAAAVEPAPAKAASKRANVLDQRHTEAQIVAEMKARLAGDPTTHEGWAKVQTEAMIEHRAVQAWRKAGQQGERPATPNLDKVTEINAAGSRPKGQTAKGKPSQPKAPKPAMPVRYCKNGQPMNDGDNCLSSVAYQATKGLADGRPRIGTKELRDLLTGAGIDLSKPWEVTLPNGTVIAMLSDGAEMETQTADLRPAS